MPTIDVIPMTTPRTVSAGAQLVGADGVERHPDDFPEEGEPDRHVRYSFLNASMGSSRAARRAGYRPKNRPTSAVIPMPSATDQSSTDAGTGVNRAMVVAIARAEQRADHATENRQHDRLGEDLRGDVAAPGAQRLAQTDLPGPLGDHHEHDVHDHDSADHEREADHADQHREDAVGRRVVDIENRVRGEDAEVVTRFRLQATGNPQRERRFVHRLRDQRDVARLHRDRQPGPRAEDHLKLAERDDRELILRLPEERAALGAHADDAEVDAFELDHLVQWIEVGAKQPIGGPPAEHDHRTCGVDFRGAHEPSAFRVEAREFHVLAADPLDARLIDRLVAIRDAPAGGHVHHHRRRQLAVAANRPRIGHRQAGIVPDLVEVLVAARNRELLDVERVGAGLIENRRLDGGVEPLDQRHHGDDRRDRDDVAEHGHERPQLRRPDGVERDQG